MHCEVKYKYGLFPRKRIHRLVHIMDPRSTQVTFLPRSFDQKKSSKTNLFSFLLFLNMDSMVPAHIPIDSEHPYFILIYNEYYEKFGKHEYPYLLYTVIKKVVPQASVFITHSLAFKRTVSQYLLHQIFQIF